MVRLTALCTAPQIIGQLRL